MKIKAHQTFFIRAGWLYKGLSNVVEDNVKLKLNEDENKTLSSDLFISQDSMNRLGLGSAMVKSLRYWMVATGLTSEIVSGISKGQRETRFGSLVYTYDRHFEKLTTLLLCHYFIATNENDCTSWYYFFNEFPYKEFTKDDLFLSLNDWICSQKVKPAESSILSDVNCIIKTYYNERDVNFDTNIFEDNKKSPLSVLGLIVPSLDNKVFYKNPIAFEKIPSEVAMYILLRQIESSSDAKSHSINFDTFLMQSCSLKKVFNLNTESVIKLMLKLEREDFIRYVKTAGLEQIIIKDSKKDSNYYLRKCYEREENEK